MVYKALFGLCSKLFVAKQFIVFFMIHNVEHKTENLDFCPLVRVQHSPVIGQLHPIKILDSCVNELPWDKLFSDRITKLWIPLQNVEHPVH